MTILLVVLLVGFADPPAVVDPPAKGAKKVEPAKKDDAKKDGDKKDAPSLFKKKKSAAKPKDQSDDAGLTPEGPAPAKTDEKAKEKSKLSNADKDLVRSLGGDLAGEEDDPLQRAAQRMRAVEEQLAKLQVEEETVVTQEKIVADLKEIIERAKKRQQQQQQKQQQQNQKEQNQQEKMQQKSQQQNQQQSNQPAQKAGGPRNAKEQLEKAKEQRDVWGHLPELERQLLNQSFKEEKLPEFRTQLEKYYSKIAEMSAEKDK
jgi:hypothetical protein